jgi:hypothetical protein
LLLTAISVSVGQEQLVKYKYFAPGYVSPGSDFQITSLIKFEVDSIADFTHQLIAGDKFQLDSVKICAADSMFNTEFLTLESDEIQKKIYEINFSPKDSIISHLPFIQILYFGKALQTGEIEYHFRYRSLFEDSLDFNQPFFVNTENNKLNVYGETFYSQTALRIPEYLKIKIPETIEKENGALSIWVKFTEPGNFSFGVTSNDGIDSLMKFMMSKTGLVHFAASDLLTLWDDLFISGNVWTKFQFAFNSSTDELELFVNSVLIASVRNVHAQFIRDVSLFIQNSEGKIDIDDVSYAVDNREVRKSLNHYNFLPSSGDSLQILYSQNFEDYFNPSDTEPEIILDFGEAIPEKTEGNLPIFSPAPELSMKYFGNYYELEWEPQNGEYAEEFIVQKSVDGNSFEDIFQIDADPDERDKIYTYSDSKDLTSEVVYYRVIQLNKDNSEVFSNQLKVGQGAIEEFSLEQNYPNPFNPVTNITLEVFISGDYKISVYDLVGKKMVDVYQGNLGAGKHSFTFDGSELPSGIYFYEVVSPSSSQVMKMILAK